MDIKVFSQFNNIVAGFSTKPDKSDVLRDSMATDAAKRNAYVIRPCLVHGKEIKCITKADLRGESYIEIDNIDGLVTNCKNVRLTSTHGDCLPIYAYDPFNNVIGLAHAGWKGTALGIAEELINVMTNYYKCNPSNIYAYIGPGIDKCHFEFSEIDAEEWFYNKNEWTKEYSSSEINGKVMLDLKGINKHFLQRLGLHNIDISTECTFCNSKDFYSYRRSKDTDRMLAYIEII